MPSRPTKFNFSVFSFSFFIFITFKARNYFRKVAILFFCTLQNYQAYCKKCLRFPRSIFINFLKSLKQCRLCCIRPKSSRVCHIVIYDGRNFERKARIGHQWEMKAVSFSETSKNFTTTKCKKQTKPSYV
jgi:hypothetical protein